MASKRPNHRPAVRHLKRSDPTMATIIKQVGPCKLKTHRRSDLFHDLVSAIIHQQLNGHAAKTIFGRFRDLYPEKRFPAAQDILDTPPSKVRTAGISPQKASYIFDLSRKVVEGDLDLRAVRSMADDDLIEELTKVKGVGRWTAEMVLMFTLGRPDILPVDDYGFRRGVQRAYRMRKLPMAERLEKLAQLATRSWNRLGAPSTRLISSMHWA